MINKQKIRSRLDRLKRFIKFRILHADDSPHRLALGVAIGLFVAWTPLLGLHTVLAIALAFLLRANKFLAIAFVWVNNPVTFLPIYYPAYLVGKNALLWFRRDLLLTPQQVAETIKQFASFTYILTALHTTEFWKQLGTFALQTGLELLVGGFIIGTIIAIVGYVTIFHLTTWYRKKHPVAAI